MVLGKFMEDPSGCDTWKYHEMLRNVGSLLSLLRSLVVSSHIGKGLLCHLLLDKPFSPEQSLSVIVGAEEGHLLTSPSPGALGILAISVSFRQSLEQSWPCWFLSEFPWQLLGHRLGWDLGK